MSDFVAIRMSTYQAVDIDNKYASFQDVYEREAWRYLIEDEEDEKEKNKTKKNHFVIFGMDLSNSPEFIQLAVCCCGVFFFYLIYGYMQVSFTFEVFAARYTSRIQRSSVHLLISGIV